MDQKLELIKVGLKSFATQPFSSTGIRQITKLADTPTGSFHYYFKNKEEFALAVLDYFFEHELIGRGNSVLFDNTLTAKQKIITTFKVMINYHIENSENDTISSCIMGNLGQEIGSTCEVVGDKVCDLFEKISSSIASLIELGKIDGSISTTLSVNKFSHFLFDAYEGTLLRRKVMKSDQPLHDFLNIIDDLL